MASKYPPLFLSHHSSYCLVVPHGNHHLVDNFVVEDEAFAFEVPLCTLTYAALIPFLLCFAEFI